jgi:hypothetical protein
MCIIGAITFVLKHFLFYTFFIKEPSSRLNNSKELFLANKQ